MPLAQQTAPHGSGVHGDRHVNQAQGSQPLLLTGTATVTATGVARRCGTKEFPGRNGDHITVSAGTGFDLVFTNVSNGDELRLPSRFSSTTTITHSGRSKTVVLGGWNVLFLFPTDVPAGPSTTLHAGLVVYEDDGSGNFTVDQHLTRSRTTDICAAVS